MKLLVFACLVAYVSAHACLVFPQQRGGFPNDALNKQGADACGLTNAPCGGTRPETSYTISFKGGMTYNVTFQKNLDHYYEKAPGYWAVSVWDGSNQQSLLNISDPSTDKVGSGDFVTAPIKMPSKGEIMQLEYGTNNPGVDKAVFYACADIKIE